MKRSKSIVCLPSDKGVEFCVIGQTEYMHSQLTTEKLGDINLFIKFLTWVRERRINSYWKSVATNFHIPRFIMLSYITTNSTIPNFYRLIETHKNCPVIKIRHIVSNVNRPTKKIARLLSRILTLLLSTVSSHLESSAQLMNDMNNNTRHSNHPYPCSLDIRSI